MPEKVELTLKPSGETIKPDGNPEAPMKPQRLFCTNREVAMSLLREIVLYIGAYSDVKAGRAKPEDAAKMTDITLQFLTELGDKLMIDAGLTQKDLETAAREISEIAKPKVDKPATSGGSGGRIVQSGDKLADQK